jgi:hypothetical protein
MDLDGAVMLAGWATATARDHKDHAETDAVPINAFLGCQVWLAGWPSPVVGDGWNPDTPESIQHEIDHHNLRGMVHLASWLTPKVKTGAYQYANGNHETPVLNLEGMAELAGWPTPMAGTPATGDYNEAGNSDYSRRVVELVRLTDSGAGPIGFLLGPNGWGDPPGLRPVESGTFPLVNGDTARLGRLRGYGDAIVAPQAATFIEAVMETIDGCC